MWCSANGMLGTSSKELSVPDRTIFRHTTSSAINSSRDNTPMISYHPSSVDRSTGLAIMPQESGNAHR